MRPHKLIMKAFGPFAGETVVDFDAMGNNIFLITGETGAGKTMIFDAMMYVLFGTASGDRRKDMNAVSFHCDFAKHENKKDAMRVEFSFSDKGHDYIVTKELSWGEKGTNKGEKLLISLTEDGEAVVPDKGGRGKGNSEEAKYAAIIEEKLGINADQFKRIIMLAQGEFQKFLTAAPKERGAILGKLFDNRKQQDLQVRLNAAKLELKRRDDENNMAITSRISEDFRYPEDISVEVRQEISAAGDGTIEKLQEIVSAEQQKLSADNDLLNKLRSEKERMTAERKEAEAVNKKLDSLNEKLAAKKENEAKKPQIDNLRQLISLGSKAVKVSPLEKSRDDAQAALEAAVKIEKDLLSEQSRLDADEAGIREKEQNLREKLRPQAEVLRREIEKITMILPIYQSLEDCRKKWSDANKKVQQAGQEVTKENQLIADKTKKLNEEIIPQLKKLENAGDVAIAFARNQLADEEKRGKAITALKDELNDLQEKKNNQPQLEKAVEEQRMAALAAEREHLCVSQQLYASQAAVLADGMRKELEEKAEVTCPVCGTVHTRADSGKFATADREKVPTKEEVAAALNKFADANAKITEKEALAKQNKEYCEQKAKEILAEARQLEIKCAAGEFPQAADMVTAENACAAEIGRRKAALEQAKTDRDNKQALAAEKEKTEQEINAARDKQERITKEMHAAEQEKATQEEAGRQFAEQLKDYPKTKIEAEDRCRDKENQCQELEKQIGDTEQEIQKHDTEKSNIGGQIDSAKRNRQERQTELSKADEEFQQALTEYDFSTAEEYIAALSPAGVRLSQKQLEDYLAEQQETVNDFDNGCRENNLLIKQLSSETEGKEYQSLDGIDDKISQQSEEIAELEKKVSVRQSSQDNNERVIQKLTELTRKKVAIIRAMNALKPMADKANDKAMPFSRYVLEGFYRQILELANEHFRGMIGDEYELIPGSGEVVGDSKSSPTDLDLKIRNAVANQVHECESLSGGQTFEASLALALALSDMAQQQSTGSVSIESMFIDEGFGTLSDGDLDRAMKLLQGIAGGKRQIGIISHVKALEELPNKIRVQKTRNGSTVSVETENVI